MPYYDRICELKKIIGKKEAIFITSPVNVLYFSGIDFCEDAYILIVRNKSYLISDSRYKQELASVPAIFEPIEIEQDLFSTVCLLLPKDITDLLVENQFPLGWVENLRKKKRLTITNHPRLNRLIRKMRSVKTDRELRILKRNFKLHNRLISLWQQKVLSLTERQGSLLWKALVVENGCDDVAFPSIVAVGSSASKPHYKPGKKRITSKLPMLFDSGLSCNNYKTDLTRMFFTDRINQRFEYCLKAVQEAQERAFSYIRAGIQAKELDLLVRKFFRSKGLDSYFVHSLGHGIGLQVHEAPTISSNSEDVLEENMVFTVEPGLYIPGKFGIRIEDVVVVTKRGCRIISR